MTQRAPRVGDIVFYQSYGTAKGEYSSLARAAVVTQVNGPGETPDLGLCVLNPSGQFFNESIPYDGGGETLGDPSCEVQASHGHPFHYCACGWIEAHYAGGTWHHRPEA